MGGGLSFAVEVNDDDLIRSAASSSTYFGIPELAELFDKILAAGRDDALLEGLAGEYIRVTGEEQPGPGVIERAFEAKLQESPHDFDDTAPRLDG